MPTTWRRYFDNGKRSMLRRQDVVIGSSQLMPIRLIRIRKLEARRTSLERAKVTATTVAMSNRILD